MNDDRPTPNAEPAQAGTDAAIRVLLFGALRDEVGAPAVTLRMPVPATGAQLLERLAAEHPAVARWQGALRLAVDQQYAAPGTVLSGSEEVALIPPVSGG